MEGLGVSTLTKREWGLLKLHLTTFSTLDAGSRQPQSDAEGHFVAVCRGTAPAETDYEIVYAKWKSYSQSLPTAPPLIRPPLPPYVDQGPVITGRPLRKDVPTKNRL